MSRFYDEFYKQKGTRHDDLVIKCVTDDDLRSKITEISVAPVKYEFEVESCDGIRWFAPGANIEQRYRSAQWNRENRSCTNTGCNHHPSNEGGCPWIDHGKELLKLKGTLYKPVGERKSTYETEVVCRNGNFIVGYADIVFGVTWNLQNAICVSVNGIDKGAVQLNSEWAKWFIGNGKDYTLYDERLGYRIGTLSEIVNADTHPFVKSVLVEVKPDLTDIGSIIRQLKTYKDLLQGQSEFRDIQKTVVVTYSSVKPTAVKLLENEGITCITTSEDGRI